MTAFRFLGPAAAIFAVLDVMDAWRSKDRGQYGLAFAQVASAAGTVATIAGISAGYFTSWAAAAAILGVVGGVLIVGAIIAILILSEEDWVSWLRDNPLSLARKGQKPLHDDLQDTLQKLAGAQQAISL